MSIADDSKDFSLQKGIRDRVLELQEAGLVIPAPSATETAAPATREEDAPLGYIAVLTQQWQRVSADKTSKDSFNPEAIYRWTRAGFETSRRPRVKADGDQEVVYVYPPAPKSYEAAERQHESLAEWKARVYREGGNGSLRGIDRLAKRPVSAPAPGAFGIWNNHNVQRQ